MATAKNFRIDTEFQKYRSKGCHKSWNLINVATTNNGPVRHNQQPGSHIQAHRHPHPGLEGEAE